jgi:hypothetical protein
MTCQQSAEVSCVPVRNEAEQHRLLAAIERMHREGRSEAEIVEEIEEIGELSRSPRPIARLKALRPGWRLSGHADDAVRSN